MSGDLTLLNLMISRALKQRRRGAQRYSDFLHADSGESFIEWLKRKSKKL